MTLYKHFRSKDELIRQALVLYSESSFDRFVTEYQTKSLTADSPKPLCAFDVIEGWVSDPSFRGPLLSRICHEMQYPENIMKIVRDHDARMVRFLQDELEKEHVRSSEAVARQLYLLFTGALEMTGAHDWPGAVAQAREVAKTLFAASSPVAPATC